MTMRTLSRPDPTYRVTHIDGAGLTQSVSYYTADELTQHLDAINAHRLLTTGGLAPGETYRIERLRPDQPRI